MGSKQQLPRKEPVHPEHTDEAQSGRGMVGGTGRRGDTGNGRRLLCTDRHTHMGQWHMSALVMEGGRAAGGRLATIIERQRIRRGLTPSHRPMPSPAGSPRPVECRHGRSSRLPLPQHKEPPLSQGLCHWTA